VVASTRTWRRNSRHILATLKDRGALRPSQARYWGTLIPFLYAQDPLGLLGGVKHAAARLLSLFRPSPSFLSRAERRLTAQKSTALAAATFMLALRAEGWDSCPLEGFDPWRARRFLGLHRGAEVCMFIAVGRRAGQAIWWERMLVPRGWVVREV
jgi:nitroreductase